MKNIYCKGTTLKGLPCKLTGVNNGYCRHHISVDCCVCMNTIKKDIVELKCNHSYCKTCIYTWICKAPDAPFTCPMCRATIESPVALDAYRWGLGMKYIVNLQSYYYSIKNISEDEYIEIKDLVDDVINKHIDVEAITNLQIKFIILGKLQLFYKIFSKSVKKISMCKADSAPPNGITFIIHS